MPKVSLVVCLHGERDLLERLLEKSRGYYDDLVVVHDGPDEQNIRALVEAAGGRFFEGPRAFQQEPHWPLAWGQACHDWILKLDADEFPSAEMKQWLQQFRDAPEPMTQISGYTCIWPLWDGRKAVSKRWPAGRLFLFHKQRVRYFGMVEQLPVADGVWDHGELVLHHEPKRKAYGLRNIVGRPRAQRWRKVIATSLLGKPTDFPCWRWTDENWPAEWEQIRKAPLQTAVRRLSMMTLRGLRDQWRREKYVFPIQAFAGPLHHALVCVEYWKLRRQEEAGRGRARERK